MLPENDKRVAVFSLAYQPMEGGAEVALRAIMGRLKKYSFTVFTHRFSKDSLERETQGNIFLLRLSSVPGLSANSRLAKILYPFSAFFAAERAHKEKPFTAIWGIMAAYAGLGVLLFKLRHPRIPFLLTLQEGDSEDHILSRVGLFYPIWKLIFRRADYIQAISEYLKDFAIRHGAFAPIEVVPNGVELSVFENSKRAPGDKDKKVIVTTSRLVWKNGIDILIKAAKILKDKEEGGFAVRIVGSGPLEIELKKLVSDLGLNEIVSFAGHVPPEKIPEELLRADIFARPSRSEGLGSSFLEAMAAGLAVIGTPVGGIPDFLKDGENGLLVKTESPDDLASKLLILIKDRALRDRLGVSARRLIVSGYGWDMVASRMAKIFDSCLVNRNVGVMIATGIFPPDIGGSASYSSLLIDELPKVGVKTSVITYGSPVKAGVRGVSKHWPKGLRHFIYFWKLVYLSRSKDIILAADSSVGAALPAALAALALGKKLVVRVTGDYAWEQGQQRFGVRDLMDDFQKKRYGSAVELLRRLEHFSVRSADLVIAPSNYLRSIVLGWGVSGRVKVIYNAIDIPPAIARAEARRKIGLTGTVAVSAGRLVPWKGFMKLVEIVPKLLEEFPDYRLVILGAGPDTERIRNKISALRLGDHVIMTGAVTKTLLGEYLAAADVFVLNTAYEGLSHQLIEAVSVKDLPVIATYVGGNRELIDQDALKIAPVFYNDDRSILEAMRRALRGDLRRDLMKRDYASIAREFGKEVLIENLLQAFNSLL